MRGLILAFTFLTRLPMPQLTGYEEKELSSCAVWFPLIGLVIGLLLILTAYAGMSANPWMAALLVVLVWTGVSGALHLDGASDMADALGASHRDPDRLMAVMKDPHIGTFGVIAIVMILLVKLVTVAWLMASPEMPVWAILLTPAWARFGSVFWAYTLEPISPGSGERFSWRIAEKSLWLWGSGLFMVSWFSVSLLFAVAALATMLLWRAYLKWRLGGMSGDCLGAGIEWSECLMLLSIGLI